MYVDRYILWFISIGVGVLLMDDNLTTYLSTNHPVALNQFEWHFITVLYIWPNKICDLPSPTLLITAFLSFPLPLILQLSLRPCICLLFRFLLLRSLL